MLPADGIGAPPPPQTSHPEPAAQRLASALDRIAAALVHRDERDAAARDRHEHGRVDDERLRVDALDAEATAELRERVDAAIGRVRAALGDAAA